MAPSFRRGGFGLITTLTLVTLSGAAVAQDAEDIAPEWVRRLAIDPESEGARNFAAQQKVRVDAEKQMRKIRHQHFRSAKNAPPASMPTRARPPSAIAVVRFWGAPRFVSVHAVFVRAPGGVVPLGTGALERPAPLPVGYPLPLDRA